MNEKERIEEWLKDLPAPTENPAFKPEEMIVCQKCARANPPNRLQCLYCAAQLKYDDGKNHFRPHLRRLEAWEKGFNVIYSPSEMRFDKDAARGIAKTLNLETEIFERIISGNKPLPLARAESEIEAQTVGDILREAGIASIVLSDETLAAEHAPRRLRGIEFDADKIILILFNRDEIFEIANEDLILIVAGAMFERKIAATEKYSNKGDNEIVKTTEMATDESLIDIYSRADFIGCRIFAKGFDFSCLAAEKEMFTAENLKKLVRRLRELAPNVSFNEDYPAARESLKTIWEVEQKVDSKGMKRKSFGQFNLENTTTINNLSQFTKYSRMQRNLYEKV